MVSRLLFFRVTVALLLLPRSNLAFDNTNRASPTDADEQALGATNFPADAEHLLEYVKAHCGDDRDLLHLSELIHQLGSGRFPERESASQRLIALGPVVLPALLQAKADPDPEVVRRALECVKKIEERSDASSLAAAVRTLSKRQPEGLAETFLRYLPYAADEGSIDEIWHVLDKLAANPGKCPPAYAAALKDPLPARRAAAACILGHRGTAVQRAAVRALLNDRDANVRLRAAQGLVAGSDKSGIPTLVELLQDPAIEIAWQAEELLHWVARNAGPTVTVGDGSHERTSECARAWTVWWQQNGDHLDMAEVHKHFRRPGLILLSQPDAKPQPRVWLCGSDGRLRWQLQGLDEPVLIQVLPQGRFLLSEARPWGPNEPRDHWRERVITERSVTGNLLWQYTSRLCVPTCIERLGNGNTWLGDIFLRQIAEVTPGGSEVFFHHTYIPEGLSNCQFPQKLANGHVVCLLNKGRGPEAVIEFDQATAKIVKQLPLNLKLPNDYLGARLPDGHYLMRSSSKGHVLELDSQGKTIREHHIALTAAVAKLPNGNLLISCGTGGMGKIVEMTAAGHTVWELFTETAPRILLCFNLLRVGLDEPHFPDTDLATSPSYRLAGIASKDKFIRQRSASELQNLGDCLPGLVPRLIDLLDDEDPVVQGGVCNALQKVGAAAFPAIVRATKDHRVRVRSSAVGLLGGFVKHPEAVLPVILASFSDDEVLVRRAAVGALSWFLFVRKQSPELPSLTQEQRHRIVRTLASALSDKDQASSCHDFTVDVRAAITLIDLGPEASEAIPDFLAALKSPAIPLKGRAIAALGYLKAERRVAIPAILQALAENVPPNEADTSYLRQCAIGALSILADPGPESEPAIPLLLWGLEEKSLDTIYHRLAAQALGKIGPKARPAITPLQDLLTARRNLVADPDPQFRVELEKALTNIGK